MHGERGQILSISIARGQCGQAVTAYLVMRMLQRMRAFSRRVSRNRLKTSQTNILAMTGFYYSTLDSREFHHFRALLHYSLVSDFP